jgi:hypothetical protein
LNALLDAGALELSHIPASKSKQEKLDALFEEYDRIASSLADPVFVPSMTDGTPLDESVFVRGNPDLKGDRVPRRFLAALDDPPRLPIEASSGRLAIAGRMLADSNPFPARVRVNRVWHHLFGQGLVKTTDDFGEMGTSPSHPELLDWLADWYRTEAGWSTKRLIRLLMTSNTYRMSIHAADDAARDQDPSNRLLHRMPIKRLEGEVIRDAILAVSGRLDPGMFGPPVPIHLTPFMNGHARPPNSGPLDGNGRRSIYIEVRRNFLSPMMQAFDQPPPFSTVGNRNVSNVPAQGLILMNDPFVQDQATYWAKQLVQQPEGTVQHRIRHLYEKAYSRPPSSNELQQSIAFLRRQAGAYGLEIESRLNTPRLWADLCHALLNAKEFIYLN